ncbi:histidine kinase [Metabacillus indicus]|uniref:sensor histidine kinase n=1 Tax=Metabacillus indicus TaxID=246786 RepID=UPI00317C1D9C
MIKNINLYQKFNIILILFIVPIALLNLFSYHTSNTVVKKEIEKSGETNLALLIHQIDAMTNELSSLALVLNRDPSVRSFVTSTYALDPYDRYSIYSNLQEKLALTSSSSTWSTEVSVYAPMFQKVISSSRNNNYNEKALEAILSPNWTYQKNDDDGRGNYFIRHFIEPSFNASRSISSYQLITEVTFSQQNLVKLLDLFKSKDDVNDPILFKPGFAPILNSTSNREMVSDLISALKNDAFKQSKSLTVSLDEKEYMVTIQPSNTLEWYMIDYVPLENILKPITKSSIAFYVTLVILILIGFFLSFLLYRNVQRPIDKLTHSLRSFTNGDFSQRIEHEPRSEFNYALSQFNIMAQHIQDLIESDYNSKIRLQEAKLKQLQSQIDPHFLYNCLNFIKNSARMGDEEAVVSMSLNLGAYYRYVTRLEEPLTPLNEELKLIKNFLEIQKLRIHELCYEIQIQDELLKFEMPRLIIQPIVENAVEHGIARISKPGCIRISGNISSTTYCICIEDNGFGMTTEERLSLSRKISDSNNEDQLCGLWNTYQRMKLHFGQDSRIELDRSELGGLKVCLTWPSTMEKGEIAHV